MVNRVVQLLLLGLVTVAACGGGAPAPEPGSAAPAASRAAVSLDKADYPVFPDADAGADPSVSAEDGGQGFTGEGWQTNTEFDMVGDPRAVEGGRLREYIPDFPGTLRLFGFGPESNTQLNLQLSGLVYESLLGLDPMTYDYVPALATHWQISDDKLAYRFRIDPNARWSDGTPVVADDVVATWHFAMDKGLQSPSLQLSFGKFDPPVAESKYIVRVTTNQLNWRNFLYFSGLPILPAHVLADIDGEAYLRDYNFKLLPGTGPYTLDEADIDKGNSVTIRRRSDYWAEAYRRNVGLHNFDEIREVVVREQNLAFEMFKKGDLDYYYFYVSRMWVEETNFDRIERGLIQKRKIYNSNPVGVQGLAFNTRRSPYDDIRVRKALALLMDRDTLIEKLFYGEYAPMTSYYAATPYENPSNPRNEYDPEQALALLAEAGWDSRDSEGRLTRDGQPLVIELLYSQQGSELWMTVFQEDLRRVGIGLNLRLATPETLFKLVMEREFDLVSMAWGGLEFPNPETSFHSSLADPDNTNNITGFKNSRVDELCAAYDKMFNIDERVAAIQEIDSILANEYHYILAWQAPFHRIAYWNTFGHPEGILSKSGDQTDIASLWWIDPEREARLAEAMRDSSVQLEVGETEDRYWLTRGATSDTVNVSAER